MASSKIRLSNLSFSVNKENVVARTSKGSGANGNATLISHLGITGTLPLPTLEYHPYKKKIRRKKTLRQIQDENMAKYKN